jgi:hypothetical protein
MKYLPDVIACLAAAALFLAGTWFALHPGELP